MALSAGRLDVPRRQKRLLPGQRAAVGFLDGGGGALSTVTHYASELVGRVRDRRMRAKRLSVDIGKAGFFQSDVASGAAIDNSQLRKPDLLDSIVEVALQRDRIPARPNQRQILFLVVPPLAEVILSRCDGQGYQQEQADHAKSANRVTEQRLPHRRQRIFR